ncbi:hypothetical protein [Halobaculum litoreum]|uniref:Major facilitator superfamily (MFS) profile domain-containing protein n=1 Tax=Halobaculum litoreum TaxID=3031998 RepID=A0ABD5XNJ8_9EURY|nr:hypothetical protein [Halobaculum sp. DT92]
MDLSEPTDAVTIGVGVGAVVALLVYVANYPTLFAVGTGGFVAVVVAAVLFGRTLKPE